jgi:hypothetical protein
MAANFISYKDSPVFLSPVDGIAPLTGVANLSNLIAVNSCEINFEAALEPNRFIGKSVISNDYSVSGPKKSTISLQYLPLVGANTLSGIQEASLAPFGMTGDSVSGRSIRVSNFLFNQCYLDNLSVQLQAYQPIRVSAQFTSYDSVLLENDTYNGLSGDFEFLANPTSGAYLSCLHALSTNVSGSGFSLPESKTEISINYQCARTPVYEVGSQTPRTVLLDSVTRTTSVNGENIGKVVGYSGANAILNLRFGEFGKLMGGTFNPDTDTKLFIGITGRVNSQNLSLAPGKTAEGSVSLSDIIF